MRILFVLLFSISFSFAQTAKDSIFTISGSFTDLPDSVVVTLIHPSATTPIASTVSKSKKFVLSGKIPFEGLSAIKFSSNTINYSYDIFAGPGNMTLTGKISDLNNALFSGSALQATFKKFVAIFDPQFKKLNNINESLAKENDAVKRATLTENFNTQKEIVALKMDSFVSKNNTSPVSAFLLYATKDLFSDNASATAERINLLEGAAEKSIYATVLNKEIESMLFGSIGSKAVDFTQNDINDKPVSLSSFKGKYVLLDFWASWCGPCRNENPNVVAAYKKFKAKNFTVLGVSLDRPGRKDDWLAAIKDDELTWTHVSDLKFWQNEVAQTYKIGSIPQNYLIDPEGKIVGKNLRGADLEAKLCELLGCN